LRSKIGAGTDLSIEVPRKDEGSSDRVSEITL
jgi:hypothetical protein